MSDFDIEIAKRRAAARIIRDDDLRNADFAGELNRVQRSRAAKCNKRKVARIMAAFDRKQPDSIRHVAAHDPENADRCIRLRHVELRRNLANGFRRKVAMERDLPGEPRVRGEAA